jgi:hypothetical protein
MNDALSAKHQTPLCTLYTYKIAWETIHPAARLPQLHQQVAERPSGLRILKSQAQMAVSLLDSGARLNLGRGMGTVVERERETRIQKQDLAIITGVRPRLLLLRLAGEHRITR